MASCELSIVVPVYNEIEILPQFVKELLGVLKELNISYEVVFVLDPSSDGTEDFLERLCLQDSGVKLLRMSRRFGQSICTRAGIDFAQGNAVVVMDCDLQDPPFVIPQMVDAWKGGAKVVLARRIKRSGEPITKKWIASLGYWFMEKFSQVSIPHNVGDFRLLDASVVAELQRFNEKSQFLRGLIALTGFEQKEVTFVRPPRSLGETKYNKWFGSFRMGLNGIVGFSKTLLEFVMWTGIIFSLLAFVLAGAVIFAKLSDFPFPVGNASTLVLILLVGGANMVGMGVLGLYIGRIYDETLDRPLYVVAKKVNL